MVVEYTNTEKKHKPYSKSGRKSFDALIIVLYLMIGKKTIGGISNDTPLVIRSLFMDSKYTKSESFRPERFLFPGQKIWNKGRFINFTVLMPQGH